MSERLTQKAPKGENYFLKERIKKIDKYQRVFGEAAEKLAEYEDLEGQGFLLRLPCKVGDKAWYVHKDGIDEVEVDSFVFNINLFVNVSFYIASERFGKTLTPYKTLFFTRSEAEEKLRELEGK